MHVVEVLSALIRMKIAAFMNMDGHTVMISGLSAGHGKFQCLMIGMYNYHVNCMCILFIIASGHLLFRVSFYRLLMIY